MGVVGGLRDRLIHDSFFNFVERGLTDLTWIGPNATGVVSKPVTLSNGELFDKEIGPNSIAVSSGTLDQSEAELGSNLSNLTHSFFVDVYAETQEIGKWISGDILAFVNGNMRALSVAGPTIPVYNPDQAATPILLFTVDVAAGRQDFLGRFAADQFKYHWYQLTFRIVDSYADEVYQ